METFMEVRGQTYTVNIKVASDGMDAVFSTTFNDRVYQDETWGGLRKKVMAATKRVSVRVEVPFTTSLNQDGVATGFHGSTGKIIAMIDGRSEQIKGHSDYLQPLSYEEKAEHETLRKADQVAHRRLNDFRRTHELNLDKAVREAIEKVAD
jgi:hypothetical protein